MMLTIRLLAVGLVAIQVLIDATSQQLRTIPKATTNRRSLKSKIAKGDKADRETTYYENATTDSYVGTGNPGDRVVWYNTTWVNDEGSAEAASSGHCVVLKTSPSFSYYCHYSVEFSTGTLLFEGVTPDYGQPATYMTITGGTGRFKEATGLVSTLPPASVTADQIFVNTVFLQ
jgi:hypothetical protein